MRFILFTDRNYSYIPDFKKFSLQKKRKFVIYFYKNLKFKNNQLLSNKQIIKFQKNDVILFRTQILNDSNIFWIGILAMTAVQKGARVINDKFVLACPQSTDKYYQAILFSALNLPHQPTVTLDSFNSKKESSYPALIKRRVGALGKDSKLIYSHNDLLQFAATLTAPSEFIIQPYFKLKRDVRILIFGKKVYGAVKRKVIYNSDGSIGVEVLSLTKPTPIEQEITDRVINILQPEFVGLDLLTDKNGNCWISEINMYPSFGGFQRVSKDNIVKGLLTNV